jgi:hypothetical protein
MYWPQARWPGIGSYYGRIFLFIIIFTPALGLTQPTIQWAPSFFISEIKQSGMKLTNESSPSSAEVKNAWSHISASPYVWMAWCLIKQVMYNSLLSVWLLISWDTYWIRTNVVNEEIKYDFNRYDLRFSRRWLWRWLSSELYRRGKLIPVHTALQPRRQPSLWF